MVLVLVLVVTVLVVSGYSSLNVTWVIWVSQNHVMAQKGLGTGVVIPIDNRGEYAMSCDA